MALVTETNRHSKQTEVFTPFLRTALTILRQSSKSMAIGFSMMRCFFASAALMACSAWKGWGVQMSTMSMSRSARNLS